ncbi:MAG: sugar ABC transporter ATP-binding protein, partial [Burkholderiaceae bacterium]
MSVPAHRTDPPLLVMRRVTKRFFNVVALANVDFDVRRGEIHAICGENGAGKSTLMKILSGVHAPDEGTIEYRDEPLQLHGPQAAQAVGIVMIHQELNLVPHLSVAENIWLAREPRKGPFIDRAAQRAGARACLARLGAAIAPDARVSSLSVAQQQMVEIAKALSMNAELLIMDEPTSSLTHAESGQLFKVMHELKRAGVGIVYISHRLDELAGIADRVTVLRDGQHVSTKAFAQTSIDEIVAQMVGRALTDKFPQPTRQSCAETLLEVRGLRRQGVFGPVDFDLRRGEILGFAGLIGAGRTEVARAVFGADPVDAGSVRFEGRELAIRRPADAIREGFAYVSEDRKAHGLAVKMTVAQNITLANLGAVLRHRCLLAFDRELAAARRYIDALGIRTPSPQQVVQLLSGGNQQKVVIAREIAQEPDVLIAAQPTRGLDVGAIEFVHRRLVEQRDAGRGVLLVSLELDEIRSLADRVLVLYDGQFVAELSPEASEEE